MELLEVPSRYLALDKPGWQDLLCKSEPPILGTKFWDVSTQDLVTGCNEKSCDDAGRNVANNASSRGQTSIANMLG